MAIEIMTGFLAVLALLAIACFSLLRKIKTLNETHRHEMQNLRYEFTTRMARSELESYNVLSGAERVIYDGRAGDAVKDFTGNGSRSWNYVSHQFIDGSGMGGHTGNGNEITIHRTNTNGRYELYLQSYAYANNPAKIPADDSLKTRKMKLSCEVKRESASHTLRFVFKGERTKNVLDEKDYVVFNPDWETVDLVFSIDSSEPSFLRIDDILASATPGTVVIRNIVLYEKV